ncbi:MAG: SIS domain-containing protein [Chloroflexia bacterium]
MDNTFKEIHNQANAWEQTVPLVRERWAEFSRWIEITEQTHFLFIGCGTSYYLAESAARSFQSVTGRVSTAVPASEIFLAFDSTVPRNVPLVAFVISRSGTTSEALNAARHLLGSAPGVEIVGVTCHTDTQLSGVSQYLIEIEHAAEESVVMTQSFTSMLLALQTIAALIAGDDALLEDLARLPELLRLRCGSTSGSVGGSRTSPNDTSFTWDWESSTGWRKRRR